jgi:hypothetical protein
MLYGSSTGVFALAAALMVTVGGAQAADATRRREMTRRGTIRGVWALLHPQGSLYATSTIMYTDAAKPIGRLATPADVRMCLPASPKTSTRKSDAPFIAAA